MDVVKFIEERNRMCRSFDTGCYGCPASNCEDELLYCAVGQDSTVDAKAQIAIVEKWSAAHPHKTRQSDDFSPYLDWTKPENVKAEFIGTTDLFPEGTVLCASYNAG